MSNHLNVNTQFQYINKLISLDRIVNGRRLCKLCNVNLSALLLKPCIGVIFSILILIFVLLVLQHFIDPI